MQTDRRLADTALGERQRTHPEANDPSSAGVGTARSRRGGSGQQEAAGRRVVVDRSANEIPAGRDALPFVEEHRRLAGDEAPRVGLEELEGAGGVESVDGFRPPAGGDRLADSLGALEGERRQRREQLVELGIDDPR